MIFYETMTFAVILGQDNGLVVFRSTPINSYFSVTGQEPVDKSGVKLSELSDSSSSEAESSSSDSSDSSDSEDEATTTTQPTPGLIQAFSDSRLIAFLVSQHS